MDRQALWDKCVAFRGHACGGLTIGFQELDFSADEDVVCITENDACGVDAIQVLLGCSVGKGNLLFHLRGKQAFSFYNRKTGKAVRLVLRPTPAEYQTKEEQLQFPLPPGGRPRVLLRREARRAVPAREGPALPVPPLRRLRRGDGGAPAPAGEWEKAVPGLLPGLQPL